MTILGNPLLKLIMLVPLVIKSLSVVCRSGELRSRLGLVAEAHEEIDISFKIVLFRYILLEPNTISCLLRATAKGEQKDFNK